jgi:hypothetical protein
MSDLRNSLVSRGGRAAAFLLALLLACASASAQDAALLLKLDPSAMKEGERLQQAQQSLRLAQQEIEQGVKQGQSLDLLLKAQALDPTSPRRSSRSAAYSTTGASPSARGRSSTTRPSWP